MIKLHPNVRRQIQYLWIIVAFAILAGAIGLYIARQERMRYPWESYTRIHAEFSSGQAVTPGQGQQVTIAGVKIGEIGKVELREGRALVRMDIGPGDAKPIYRNATFLLRPKTGLNDMSIQVDPGRPDPSLPDGGELKDGDVVPEAATQPNVNPDEVLAGLDADTRRYLAIVANAGGQGLEGRGGDLRAMIRAGYPTLRETATLMRAVADRRTKVRRLVSNLRRLAGAAALKDRELARLVRASSAVVQTLGEREAELGAAALRLPGALAATRAALAQARPLADELAPAAARLSPLARELGPALTAARPLLRDATPVVRDHLRPLVAEATPLVRRLRPAVGDLNASLPPLIQVGRDANYVVNELLHNPEGPEEGFLFHTAWFFHNAASVLSIEDAHGVAWRGLAVIGCSTFATATAATPALAALAEAPICPRSGRSDRPPGGGQASGGSRPARSPTRTDGGQS